MNNNFADNQTIAAKNYSDIRLSDIDPQKAYAAAARIVSEIGNVIVGKNREITYLVTALLAGTHVLIEDVPGVGKTTLSAALAGAAGLDFRRAQFTPDITASDITGFNIYNRTSECFEFTKGLIMTNVFLADEINRASPRTQSALLEAMEEGKVTVDGKTYELPTPFMVIATQNPSGFVGTYPLPESQLDRFGIRLSMGYPTIDEELMIIESQRIKEQRPVAKPVCSPQMIRVLRALCADVHINANVCRYLVSLIAATREHTAISLGASPRASLALKRLCQAYAFINGRSYVIPEDVAAMFLVSVPHRLILTREAGLRKITAESTAREILASTPVPYKGSR